MTTAEPVLARLVADPAAFARDHWDTAPLITRAADLPAAFTDLFSSAAVDELVGERGLRTPFFRLVRDGSPVPGVTRTAVAGSRTISDLADSGAIATAYATGATIVLQSLHRTSPTVGRFCRQLAADLGHETQCNAYVTPGNGSRGFAFHHDTHDVFVLQVEGRKHWRIHRPVVELPTKSQPRAGDDLVPAGQQPLVDTYLEPGDVLYLPRGYVHAAETDDGPSVHLTIGVIALTWLELLQDVVESIGPADLPLRHALPAVTRAEPAVAATDLGKLAADWIAGLDPQRVADVVARRIGRADQPEPLAPLAQTRAAETLTPATGLRPRRGLRTVVATDGDRVSVSFRGTTVSLPAVAEQLLRAALAGPSTPSALAVGGCDEADALVVCRRLLREGLLVSAP